MGKKGSTTVQSYKPTAQEIRLQKNAADYADAVSPNALHLNNVAGDLLNGSYGTVQADYNQLNQNAQNQITGAQNTVGNLSQGVLSDAYKQNMTDAISGTMNNTIGEAVNSLGNRGVLNSSVTNTALKDASDSAANATAQNYLNSLSTSNGIAGQQAALAGQNITTTAAAQEAAQAPALALWNASLGLNSGGTLGALQAVAGQGTTISKQSGGSGLLGGVLTGLAGNSALFCFGANTKIRTPDGKRNIQDIKIGDTVISPSADGTEKEEIVREVMREHENDVYALIAEGNKGRVHTTLTQPLMQENGDFVRVKDILPGETALKGKGVVERIVYMGRQMVYDLKVTGENNYYADGFIAKGGTTEWGL